VSALWRAQNPRNRPDLDSFTLRERGKYGFMRDHLVRALHAGAIPLLAGTDASAPGLLPGQSMHVELRELVGAGGLSPLDALRTATMQPAAFIHQHVRHAPPLGTGIEVDMQADLLLLDANPLDDVGALSRLVGVAVRGRWMTKESVDAMRSAAR
jgi:imidazolonepropionase-like amidohydrolase